MWNYIIDGLVILIVLISMIVGIVKGLFDSILSLFGTGIALVVSIFTAKYIAGFINKIFNFEEFLLTKIDETATDGVIRIFGVDLQNSDVAKFVVWVIALIIMFLIVKLAIYILSKIFESISKNNPTLSGLNRVFGMIFGLAKGGITVIALLAVCSLISEVPGIGTPIYEKIADTKITSGIYKFVDTMVEENLTEEKIKDIINRVVSDMDSNKDEKPATPEGETPSGASGTTALSVVFDNPTIFEEN